MKSNPRPRKRIVQAFISDNPRPASVFCSGFIPRATMSKIIPMTIRAMPEENEAAPIHQYHGEGTGASTTEDHREGRAETGRFLGR